MSDGRRNVIPSNSSVSKIWHPNRDVGCRPQARSRRSCSSSLGVGSRAKYVELTTTWHVEHAMAPSQAPSMLMLLAQAASNTLVPAGTTTGVSAPSGDLKTILGIFNEHGRYVGS